MIKRRATITSLSLSAVALVALLSHEGYRETAYKPLPTDKLTIGFGTTDHVKPGDKTTPVQAVAMALRDVQKFEGAIQQCVTVQLFQHEYDSLTSLAYNIGPGAFCQSTLVKLLNQERYTEACEQILRWNRSGGKVVRGLVLRRQAEYEQCLGLTQ